MSDTPLQQIVRLYRTTKSPYWKRVYESLLAGDFSAPSRSVLITEILPDPKPEKPKGGFEFL